MGRTKNLPLDEEARGSMVFESGFEYTTAEVAWLMDLHVDTIKDHRQQGLLKGDYRGGSVGYVFQAAEAQRYAKARAGQ